MLSLTRCRFGREFSGVSCKRLLVAVADWNDFKYDVYLKPAVQYGQTSGIDNIVKCAICELHICLLTIKKNTWVCIYCFFCFTSCFLLTFSQQQLNVKKWQVCFVLIAQSSHAPFSTRSVLYMSKLEFPTRYWLTSKASAKEKFYFFLVHNKHVFTDAWDCLTHLIFSW